MVKWCYAKYFFSISEFFGKHLNDDRKHLKPEYSTGYKKHDESIGHHRHNSECRTKWERTDVSHDELRRLYIEPEKRYQRTTYDEAKCWQYHQALIIAYEGIYCVIKEEETTCESIESIGDIHTVRHRRDDKDKKRDIPYTEVEIPYKRYAYFRISQLEVEPVCSECTEEEKEYEFYSGRESFGSTDFFDIEIVIDESDASYCEEREKCEIGFISIEKWKGNIESETRSKILENHRKNHHEKYNTKNNSSSHSRCSYFSSMETSKLCRLSDESFFPNLLSEIMSVEKSDIWRYHEKCRNRSDNQV